MKVVRATELPLVEADFELNRPLPIAPLRFPLSLMPHKYAASALVPQTCSATLYAIPMAILSNGREEEVTSSRPVSRVYWTSAVS